MTTSNIGITNIKLIVIPACEGIDEKDFIEFIRWQRDKKILNEKIDEFKSSLYLLPQIRRYESNPPEHPIEEVVSIDGVKITVGISKKAGKIEYKQVLNDFEAYVKNLIMEYNSGITRGGVLTFEVNKQKEPYAHLGLLNDRLELHIQQQEKKRMDNGTGIQRKLVSIEPSLEDRVKNLVPGYEFKVPYERDFSRLTESNAKDFWLTKEVLSIGNKRTNAFKRRIEEETIKNKGLKKEELSPGTIIKEVYPFDNYSFVHTMYVKRDPKYKDMIDQFIKPLPKTLRKNSKIGDFALIENYKLNEDVRKKLEEKGLVKDELIKLYDPRVRNGKVYVRLNGVKKRIEEILANVKPKKESSIYVHIEF